VPASAAAPRVLTSCANAQCSTPRAPFARRREIHEEFHMRPRSVHIAFGAVVGVSLALTSVMTASAHEHRMVGGGKFMVLVGWKDEPTFTGVRNAVQFFLNDAAGKPINDLGDTLKLQVVYKDEKSGPISLMPGFDPDSGEGTPGEYDAAIIPSKAGTYTFHFTGTIHGVPVDEKFTSSEKTFDNVDEAKSVSFPEGDLGKAKEAAAPASAPAPKDAGILGSLGIPLAIALGGVNIVLMWRRRPGADHFGR
jgi:hypothetical protein